MKPEQVAVIIRRHYNEVERGRLAARTLESIVMDLAPLADDARAFHLAALGHLDAYLEKIDMDNAAAEEAEREAELRPDWRGGHVLGAAANWELDDTAGCAESAPKGRGFFCTRDLDHAMPHVATAGREVVSIWDDENFEEVPR